LNIGQGAGCNGELDATYAIINGVCAQLSAGGSQTAVTFNFPVGVDTVVLFLCLNSSAFVTICNLCADPPPCNTLPTCKLTNVNISGCDTTGVPPIYTNPADVFNFINTCSATLSMTYKNVGDTTFCGGAPGLNFVRTYTLYFLDGSDQIAFRTCSQTITVTPPAPVAICRDITVQLDNSGVAMISAADVNNGSTGCNISLSVNPSMFSCMNVGMNNVVTLTATDLCGIQDTCIANVTVQVASPTADAGPSSADVCIGSTYTTSMASFSNGTVLWTHNGNGSFNGTETMINATYTPAMSDYKYNCDTHIDGRRHLRGRGRYDHAEHRTM
jgi:hypothetical protein